MVKIVEPTKLITYEEAQTASRIRKILKMKKELKVLVQQNEELKEKIRQVEQRNQDLENDVGIRDMALEQLEEQLKVEQKGPKEAEESEIEFSEEEIHPMDLWTEQDEKNWSQETNVELSLRRIPLCLECQNIFSGNQKIAEWKLCQLCQNNK